MAIKEQVTPQMYGAVGDGVADDTAAFQKAVDSNSDVFVPTSRRETYRITRPIVITKKQCKRIFSEPTARLADVGAIIADFHGCEDPKATALFDVHISSLRISGLRIIGTSVDSHRAGICIEAMDENICDYDIRIEHCAIKNFYKVARMTGRGLECVSSLVSSSNYLYELYWIADKDTNKNHPADYNQRAIAVKNCRLHNISSGFITVKQGHCYGLHFEGNTIDNGKGYIVRSYGQAYGWNISGNVIQGIRVDAPVLDFRKGMVNCVITGNTFLSDEGYWVGQEGTVETWIKSAGTTTGSIISNNIFKNTNSAFMSFVNIEGTAIVGNVMHNKVSTTSPAISITGANKGATIVGNAITGTTGVAISSKSAMKGSAVTGNYPAT